MKRICIAVLLIGALLCVATVDAESPVKEPLSKIVLIHYKDRTESMGASATDPASNEYGFIVYPEIRWTQLPVRYYVNPQNSYGLKSGKVTETIRAAFDAWDATVATSLFSYGGTTTASGMNPDDNINVVSWRPMGNSGAIAVTTVWFYSESREIVQSDIQMNSDYPWGIDADGEGPRLLKNRFDLRNIITHEAGHVCGLGDLYTESSKGLTMNGYSWYGDVQKISLETGDILGIHALYGA